MNEQQQPQGHGSDDYIDYPEYDDEDDEEQWNLPLERLFFEETNTYNLLQIK